MDNSNVLMFSDVKVNMDSRKFFIGSTLVYLRRKEFELLVYFLRNVGKVLSRSEILEEVWDLNICCATNTVDVHVSSLRKKFRRFSAKNMIKTIHSIGYILEC